MLIQEAQKHTDTPDPDPNADPEYCYKGTVLCYSVFTLCSGSNFQSQ
jgi:hypothetical protein